MDKVNGITSGTPEDLALEGYLSRFFARKGITFDMESGLFRITNNYRYEIRLTGHGYRYAMVRKALQRNEILANRDIDSAVYIETNRQPDQFILHFPHQEDIIVHTIEELLEKLHELEPFQPLELNLKEVYGYQYMKVRFGRVNVEYYQKLEKYLFDDLNAIFLEGIRNENYVYGCYFAAHKEMGKIDSTFKSLHFENIALPDDYEGMPAEICRNLRNQIDEIEKEIENVRRLLNCSCFSFLGRSYMYNSMKRVFRSLGQIDRLSVHSIKSSQFHIGILLEHLIKRCLCGSLVRLQQFVSCQPCNS